MSFQKASLDYETWLKDQGFTISPKLAIKDLRNINQGRGILTEEDIEEDEELFTIPRSGIINVANCALVEKYPEAKDELLKLNQWEALIIVLLYELKVEQSKWLKYFDVLPIHDSDNYDFNQLMFWNDDELKLLEPSLIVQRIGKDLAEEMYSKLFPEYVTNVLKVKELAEITIEDYHKVASLIMSYSFDVNKVEFTSDDDEEDEEDEEDIQDEVSNVEMDKYFKSMVPLADTLNADTKLHNAILTYNNGLLVMKSIKQIKKGEQIYNTYSEHPNSEILRRYGYIEPTGSKHDFGEVSLSLIIDHFVEAEKLDESFIRSCLDIFKEIVNNEEELELADIVLDSYDCFINHEIIMEMIFIIQILTILTKVHKTDPLSVDEKERYNMIKRIFMKCYQLIEGKKLTKKFLSNYTQIIQKRLNQYPTIASEEFGSYSNDRKVLAEFVVKSEYKALNSCLDIEKTFNIDGEKFKFIEDEKLLRNIIKKRKSNDLTNGDNKRKKN